MLYCLNINLTGKVTLGPVPWTVIQTKISEIFAIIDTGTTANFISKHVVDKLHSNNDNYDIQDLKNNIKVNIANGSSVWVKQIISLKCIIKSEEVTIVSFIADLVKEKLYSRRSLQRIIQRYNNTNYFKKSYFTFLF